MTLDINVLCTKATQAKLLINGLRKEEIKAAEKDWLKEMDFGICHLIQDQSFSYQFMIFIKKIFNLKFLNKKKHD